MGCIVEVVSSLAGRVVPALVAIHVQDESFGLTGRNALAQPQVVDGFVGGADEASIGCDIDKGEGGWTGGYFAAIGSFEELRLVLLKGDISIDPEGVAHKIVPEDIEGSIAAVRVEGVIHDSGVVFELGYLDFELIDNGTISTGALRIDIRIS